MFVNVSFMLFHVFTIMFFSASTIDSTADLSASQMLTTVFLMFSIMEIMELFIAFHADTTTCFMAFTTEVTAVFIAFQALISISFIELISEEIVSFI